MTPANRVGGSGLRRPPSPRRARHCQDPQRRRTPASSQRATTRPRAERATLRELQPAVGSGRAHGHRPSPATTPPPARCTGSPTPTATPLTRTAATFPREPAGTTPATPSPGLAIPVCSDPARHGHHDRYATIRTAAGTAAQQDGDASETLPGSRPRTATPGHRRRGVRARPLSRAAHRAGDLETALSLAEPADRQQRGTVCQPPGTQRVEHVSNHPPGGLVPGAAT
jgi:hypothetical protein